METSLYANLLSQHPADVVPMRCSGAMLDRLIRHLEDVVVDNKLSALVLQGRCPDVKRRAGVRRLMRLAGVAQHQFLFTCDPACAHRAWDFPAMPNSTVLSSPEFHQVDTSQFMLIVDPRFSGLLASVRIEEDSPDPDAADREVVWSFDPNVVYTALEYMTARVGAYHPQARAAFERHIRVNAPSSTSLRLTLNFTTKLAILLQRQTEMETATRRISALVNNTFDTTEIIEGAVELIGRAMSARRVSLSLHEPAGAAERAVFDLTKPPRRGGSSDSLDLVPPAVEVPIVAHGRELGTLVIEDDTSARVWEEEELRMVQTVADHLAVGISHARLFRHIEEQAITDELTGAFNKRYFVDRLEREIQFAERSGRPVSLVLFDLDHFKALNDTHGHLAGDAALRYVGQTMRNVVRTVDVCARYGGEEFAVIMPSTDREAAAHVAERLRAAISAKPLEKAGHITASFGVSAYPGTAATVEALIEEADRALYASKLGGRDQVRVFDHGSPSRFEHRTAGPQ
jgi:diguanylate cyclase (GGDEF)-like protein